MLTPLSCFSPVLFLAESTSMAKFSIEMTLSTVTTFLPALSQTPRYLLSSSCYLLLSLLN